MADSEKSLADEIAFDVKGEEEMTFEALSSSGEEHEEDMDETESNQISCIAAPPMVEIFERQKAVVMDKERRQKEAQRRSKRGQMFEDSSSEAECTINSTDRSYTDEVIQESSNTVQQTQQIQEEDLSITKQVYIEGDGDEEDGDQEDGGDDQCTHIIIGQISPIKQQHITHETMVTHTDIGQDTVGQSNSEVIVTSVKKKRIAKKRKPVAEGDISVDDYTNVKEEPETMATSPHKRKNAKETKKEQPVSGKRPRFKRCRVCEPCCRKENCGKCPPCENKHWKKPCIFRECVEKKAYIRPTKRLDTSLVKHDDTTVLSPSEEKIKVDVKNEEETIVDDKIEADEVVKSVGKNIRTVGKKKVVKETVVKEKVVKETVVEDIDVKEKIVEEEAVKDEIVDDNEVLNVNVLNQPIKASDNKPIVNPLKTMDGSKDGSKVNGNMLEFGGYTYTRAGEHEDRYLWTCIIIGCQGALNTDVERGDLNITEGHNHNNKVTDSSVSSSQVEGTEDNSESEARPKKRQKKNLKKNNKTQSTGEDEHNIEQPNNTQGDVQSLQQLPKTIVKKSQVKNNDPLLQQSDSTIDKEENRAKQKTVAAMTTDVTNKPVRRPLRCDICETILENKDHLISHLYQHYAEEKVKSHNVAAQESTQSTDDSLIQVTRKTESKLLVHKFKNRSQSSERSSQDSSDHMVHKAAPLELSTIKKQKKLPSSRKKSGLLFEASSSEEEEAHIQQQHVKYTQQKTESVKLKCPYCRLACKSQTGLRAHILIYHPNRQQSTGLSQQKTNAPTVFPAISLSPARPGPILSPTHLEHLHKNEPVTKRQKINLTEKQKTQKNVGHSVTLIDSQGQEVNVIGYPQGHKVIKVIGGDDDCQITKLTPPPTQWLEKSSSDNIDTSMSHDSDLNTTNETTDIEGQGQQKVKIKIINSSNNEGESNSEQDVVSDNKGIEEGEVRLYVG